MEQLKEFVLKHFKVITVVLTFVLTMYIQHLNNTRQIEELLNKCEVLDTKIKDQYERIDAIKLDKAVFEATITQFASIQNDLHEIREDLRALLKVAMIQNAHITVITSKELTAMRLDDLVGCRGLVVEVLAEDRTRNRGALVLLEEPYLGEYLWFIPENSISYE